MSQITMLRGTEPREMLNIALRESIPAILSYASKDKWHATKVKITNLGAAKLEIDLWPNRKPHPINIQMGQQVVLTFKYGYGKFIFDAKILGLEPPSDSSSGGKIVLMVPNRVQVIQRRSYYRVRVPNSLEVNVLLRHRQKTEYTRDNCPASPCRKWYGKLIDISAGGIQIVVNANQKPDLKKGQPIELEFQPNPFDDPLQLEAQVRTIIPTANLRDICFGLQLVGLETNFEGRKTLARLIDVVELYHQMNQSAIKPKEMQPTETKSN